MTNNNNKKCHFHQWMDPFIVGIAVAFLIAGFIDYYNWLGEL